MLPLSWALPPSEAMIILAELARLLLGNWELRKRVDGVRNNGIDTRGVNTSIHMQRSEDGRYDGTRSAAA